MTEKGIIIRGVGGFYTVKYARGELECNARGKFRKENIIPTVGDYVEISLPDSDGDEGNIVEILPRKNRFVRPPVSNIDQMVVVLAAKSPEPDFLLIDKVLANLSQKNIDAILCINKIDLDDAVASEIADIYRNIGYPVLLLSAKDKNGLNDLLPFLKDKITAFAGNSGVGKSSILNELSDNISLITGSVSAKIQRGRHTTKHVLLLPLEAGGFVLDTPGFCTFDIEDAQKERLDEYFHEFVPFNDLCRFKTCAHISEPGCAVKDALSRGEISNLRYENYVKIYDILNQKKKY